MGRRSELSDTQRNALSKIIKESDDLAVNERIRWNGEHSGWIDASDIAVRTIHALANRGMIEFRCESNTISVQRRGAFGRVAGMGTKNVSCITMLVKVTDLGRRAMMSA